MQVGNLIIRTYILVWVFFLSITLSPYSIDHHSQVGLTLFRICPLAISSVSIMFSWAQDELLSSFLDSPLYNDPKCPSREILPRYLAVFMHKGLKEINLIYLISPNLYIVNRLAS
jgi:hypothetical protein